MNTLPTFRLEGSLFVPDLMERFLNGALDAQYPIKLPPGLKSTEECNRAFRIASAAWERFCHATASVHSWKADHFFLTVLFRDVFGWGDEAVQTLYCAPDWLDKGLDDSSFPASKFNFVTPPVTTDRLTTMRRTPSQSVQELVNHRDDLLWVVLCNGRSIRLFRDNFSLTRPAFVEFNLERIFSEHRYPDFKACWWLFHASRLGPLSSGQDSVWEALRNEGI